MFQENDFIRLITNNGQIVYGFVKEEQENKTYKVRILKQPIHELTTMKYSTTLFKQFCHEDDIADNIEMNYESKTMCVSVHHNMMDYLGHNEMISLLKHLVLTGFGGVYGSNTTKNDRQRNEERHILLEGLDSLKISSISLNA